MQDIHLIYGIHVHNRANAAVHVQQLLTEYGCSIKTRLGLHNVADNMCSPSGVILLEMFGDRAECDTLKEKLDAVDGVEVQVIEFKH